jgi:hypothetical protein
MGPTTNKMPTSSPTPSLGLNRHATRFVPRQLQNVNTLEPLEVVHCPGPHYLDFEEYAHSFLPKGLFEKVPSTQFVRSISSERYWIGVEPDGAQIPLERLSVENYVDHFRNGLIEERRQLKEEFKLYDLYEVKILPYKKDSYALTVPGLRDYVPGVLVGDAIKIRCVRPQPSFNIYGMVGTVDQFDKIEYVAYISGIDRLKVRCCRMVIDLGNACLQVTQFNGKEFILS